MARYSAAYSGLIRRLDEISLILALANELSRRGPTSSNSGKINALCRGGIVLLCSHIEGYVEELGSLAIARIEAKRFAKSAITPSFKYHLSRDIIRDIQGMRDPLKVAARVEDLLVRDGHIWGQQPNFSSPLSPSAFTSDFATPRHSRIKRFFNRFGYNQFESELSHHLHRDYRASVNMVNQVVTQRNSISHGDYSIVGAPSDLKDMLTFTKLYCRATDIVVGNWFSRIGCPIR